MKNKLAVFLTALILSFSFSAMAFEGFSLGASYSSIDYSTTGKERTNGATLTSSVISADKTVKGTADKGSIFAEYTFSQGSTIGIDYVEGSAEIGKASRTSTTPSGTVTAKATAKNPITLYAEPTYMFTPKFGVYVKGGVTEITVSPSETDTANVTTSTYIDKDLYGRMMGAGAKFYVGNFFVKGEYTETDFATYSHISTTGEGNTITADIDTKETRIAIGYNF